METEDHTKISFGKHLFFSAVLFALITLTAFVVTNIENKETASADSPIFFFSEDGCNTVASNITRFTGNSTLHLCVNGKNEGSGFLGAEVNILYPPNLIEITNIKCDGFYVCIDDMSEFGLIRLLAAADVASPLDEIEKFATINVNLPVQGNANLIFTKSDVIDENKNIISRTDTSGLAINIQTSPLCGNGIIDEGEECDGVNLNNQTCTSLGYSGGNLVCTTGCLFDKSGCITTVCGDGIVGPGEECDPPDGIICDDECKFIATPPDEETDELPEDLILESVDVRTRFPITSIEPDSTAEVFTFANYSNGTSGTVTSCFPCPTFTGDSRSGLVTYRISGPARFSGNLLIVNAGANEGDRITFSASYNDYKSGETKTSISRSLIVTKPADIPVTEPPEEIWETEEVSEIFKIIDEPLIDNGELDLRPSAPDEAKVEAMAITAIELGETLSTGYELPTYLDKEKCKDFSNEIDSDGDGLSDKTECYIGTDPFNPDSDGDGCWDGDEINQFYTDPLNGSDCSIESRIQEMVTITDPQPGWIVSKLRVSGITPKNTKYLSVVVFNSEYIKVKAVIDALDVLTFGSTSEEIEMELNDLESVVHNVNSFIQANPLYEYEDLSGNMNSLASKIKIVRETEDDPLTPENEKKEAVMNNFGNNGEWLRENRLVSENLGFTSEFLNTAVGDSIAKGFRLDPDIVLLNGKLYDIVAIATMPDGNMKSSGVVRFSVDSELSGEPIPRSIGGENIPEGTFSLGDIFIGSVLAKNGNEIEITDMRPIITGDSEYGAQVFAIWESIVLASSIIADSEQGAFAIQAPQNLEANKGHKVSLYAVKTDEISGNKMRSDNVDVYFRVSQKAFPMGLFLWTIGIIALLILLIFVLKKRMHAKREKSEEELAKEIIETKHFTANEKAIALTDEKIEEPPFAPIAQEPTPEEHMTKEQEVIAAFAESESVSAEDGSKEYSAENNEIKILKERLIETDEKLVENAEYEVEKAQKELEEARKKLVADMQL